MEVYQIIGFINMDLGEIKGLKNKYYKKGFEDALYWIIDIIKDDSEGDLDCVLWEIRKLLNNEN